MTWGYPVRPDPAAIVRLADQATRLSGGEWSVAFLLAAFPGASRAAILGLPVGARDRLVLSVRAVLVRGPLRSEPLCSACGTTYDLTLDPAELGFAAVTPWPAPEPREVTLAGQALSLRPVSVDDLIAVEAVADPDAAAALLAERVGGRAAAGLAIEDLSEALEALDPLADVWVGCECPECGARQSMAFDPVAFVAREIDGLVLRLLRDVADIARVFHWSERDILALPDHRRAFYLAEALA
jgi:rubredoxin